MDNDQSTGGNVEPVWVPLVRFEATLRTVGNASVEKGKEFGETEACPMAPLVTIEAELKSCPPSGEAKKST